MPKTPRPKITKKGSGLKRKLGPLPLWAWGGIVLILGYYLYSRTKNSPSPGNINSTTGYVPTTTVTPQQAASAGTPSPNSDVSAQLDPAVLASLGAFSVPGDYVNQTDLNSQLSSLSDDVSAQIAGITFATPTASSPGVTLPATSTKPKTAPQAKATVKPKAKTPVAPKKITYYTYKKNVKLMKGQTLHYTTGKGYYAA